MFNIKDHSKVVEKRLKSTFGKAVFVVNKTDLFLWTLGQRTAEDTFCGLLWILVYLPKLTLVFSVYSVPVINK